MTCERRRRELPPAFLMIVHIAAFAMGAGFAWLAFKRAVV
jgi:hypothetical protein